MKFFSGLARWPLLLGATVLFIVALWEESHDTGDSTMVAVVAVTVGSVLLGAWIYSVASEAERMHHEKESDSDGGSGLD